MSVSEFSRLAYVGGQAVCPQRIGKKRKRNRAGRLHSLQGDPRRRDVGLQPRLNTYAHETEFGQRAGMQCHRSPFRAGKPSLQPHVVNVLRMPKSDQRVDIEQEFHGKSANNAKICSLVTLGAPLGDAVTIIPVFLFRERPPTGRPERATVSTI